MGLCAFRASKAALPGCKRPPVSPHVWNDQLKFLAHGVGLRSDERRPVLAATGKPVQQEQRLTASMHLKVDWRTVQYFDPASRACECHNSNPSCLNNVAQTKKPPRKSRERSISFHFINSRDLRSILWRNRPESMPGHFSPFEWVFPETNSVPGGNSMMARARIKECNARSSGLPSSCWD